MDHFREVKNCLSWHNEGKFEVELINGVIKKLNFCEPGKGPDDSGKSLTSTNYRYLQAVYNCLGELFDFIDEENKRLGYSFSDEGSNPVRHRVEIMELNYPAAPAETRMRPLINYSHQTDLVSVPAENDELIRDIG
jgi:hypothetical protein